MVVDHTENIEPYMSEQTRPEIFGMWWFADINDPDNFLREIFHSNSENNFGGFANPDFDQLIDFAVKSNNPEERQQIYIQTERLLCETEISLIPIYHAIWNGHQ